MITRLCRSISPRWKPRRRAMASWKRFYARRGFAPSWRGWALGKLGRCADPPPPRFPPARQRPRQKVAISLPLSAGMIASRMKPPWRAGLRWRAKRAWWRWIRKPIAWMRAAPPWLGFHSPSRRAAPAMCRSAMAAWAICSQPPHPRKLRRKPPSRCSGRCLPMLLCSRFSSTRNMIWKSWRGRTMAALPISAQLMTP